MRPWLGWLGWLVSWLVTEFRAHSGGTWRIGGARGGSQTFARRAERPTVARVSHKPGSAKPGTRVPGFGHTRNTKGLTRAPSRPPPAASARAGTGRTRGPTPRPG